MLRPVAEKLQNLLHRIGAVRTAARHFRRSQAIAASIVITALLIIWFVGQAWISAGSVAGTRVPPANGSNPNAPTTANPQEARPVAAGTLNLSPDTVIQEGELKASGSGFGPLETVIIRAIDPASHEQREVSRVAADWRGSFSSQSLKLPEWLTSGAQQLEAVGERSTNTAKATVYVRSKNRWVNLSTYGLRQGERLGFVAGGFDPGENVNVYLAEGENLQPDNSATPLMTVPTDRAGNTAWTEFQVPLVKAGTYSLMFRGHNENEALSRNIVINPLMPSVELSPWSGPPGSQLNLNATGFVPGEEVGVYLGDSTEPALKAKVDQYGNLWGIGPLTIPYEARGPFSITLIGNSSHALATRSFGVVAPKPWVELSSYAGFAGTSVFFSGGGFAAHEQITIHLENGTSQTIAVGQANEQGYYRLIGPVNVPPNASDEVTFVLVGESSHAKGTATFKVLTPWVPTSPNVGQ